MLRDCKVQLNIPPDYETPTVHLSFISFCHYTDSYIHVYGYYCRAVAVENIPYSRLAMCMVNYVKLYTLSISISPAQP